MLDYYACESNLRKPHSQQRGTGTEATQLGRCLYARLPGTGELYCAAPFSTTWC